MQISAVAEYGTQNMKRKSGHLISLQTYNNATVFFVDYGDKRKKNGSGTLNVKL